MWNRITGKSSGIQEDPPSQISRRNHNEKRSKDSRSESIVSSSSNKKSSARINDQFSKSSKKSSRQGDDPDRGFNPTSKSFSSTTSSPYPGIASASVATASGNHNDEPYIPPVLVRNASLADQMPKSRSSRDERTNNEGWAPRSEQWNDRNDNEKESGWGDHERRAEEKRGNKDKDRLKKSSKSTKSGLKGSGYREDEGRETTRGPTDFSDQIEASGFSQFPGQDNGGILNTNGKVSGPQMSSHIQDQFPGQFANQSSAPHQPPISFSEGGPGLAAEYYGDAGESVAEQPGNRANTPSLIIGAEPHLQAALAVAAPPPEPSASGEVGAAASFFTGDFDEHESATGHDQHTSATVPARPQGSHHSSSAPAIPTVSGAAIGAAAGYFMGSQNSSHTQRPNHPSSVGGAPQDHDYSSYQRPPAPTAESHYSNASRPPRPGKPSSQSSNAPLYAAGAVDVAATISQHSHQNLSQHNSLRPQNSTTPMAQRHRSHGPLEAVVEFFKDPDGVAEFEEYSEFIGVCKYCFAPGSSARDAPRKHYYRRKRSNDSLGRVDKESRYHSSENERRRGKDKSWLASSLAGYGLAKVGESLYKQRNDFDSTYSVKTGRFSPDARGEKSPRRRQSKDNNEIGITNAGKVYKKDLQGVSLDRPEAGTYESRRHSHYNSRSRDRRSGLADATISATTGSSMEAPSAPHRTSASPINAFVNIEHRNGEQLPNRRYKPHSERRQGFFSMSNAASSSSSVDTVRQSDRHQSSKRTRATSKDDRKAEAAILGLGAAAAALTPNNGRTGHRKKGVKKVTVLKKARRSHSRDSRHDHGSEDEVWESAPETEYGSADSGLAYGGPSRKGSRESLSSDSSGTNKWGWRWGRKKEQRAVPVKRNSSEDINLPVIADGAGAGSTGAAMMSHGQHQRKGNDSNSSLPLQQVFPIPTSDPTLFDVGGETSTAASKRPAVVPIQHPQPITPVSATLYATQPPQKHSYSAPTGPPVFSPKVYPSQPAIGFDARFVKPEFAAPGSFAQDIPQVKGPGSNSKFRRRDSSPARFGDDAVSSTMTSHKRASTRDDTSAVRFDRTEDQEENDRRERRRNRREDRKRREAEEQEQEQIEKERKVSTEKSDKKSEIGARRRESPQRSSETSSAAPAAAGIIGAAIGVIASEKMSTPEESREERRERRRRDREREEAEDQEATRRRERRRKEREREREREREVDESVGNEPQTISDQISRVSEDIDRQERATDKQTSDLQEARCSPTSRTSHEDYGTFFRPLDLGNSSQQAKVTSANDSADVDFDQSPSIVTVAPKGFRDPDAQPTFSPADTDEATDTSILSFPVPRLRLVEPTPPSSRGSTPITWPQDTGIEDIEEPSRDHTPSKVTWGDDQTHEYTVISPDEDDDHGQLVGSAPSDISDTGLREGSPPLDKSELPSDIELTKDSPSVPEAKYPPVSFGDDAEFAATLAASAEDAGFDPSIVVDNPMYSRRESPPGSNDRSMPGGFDDNETYSLSRKDKSRKDREAKLRFESEEPKPPDDNGVSEDIFSHVKNIDSPNRKDSVDNLPDSWGTGKRSKSKKSKKDRKQDSGFKEESYEFSGSVVKPHEPESRETYESPSEDTPSVTSSVPLTIEGDSSTKSRKKSKRDSVSFDDTASSISAPSTETASREPKSTKKSSVWARVIGRSPQENGTKDLPDEANMDKFEELRRKNKKSKGRRSNGDEIDDNEGSSKRSALGEPENNRPDSGGSVGPDLPAKDPESSPSTVREVGTMSEDSKDRNKPDIDEQRSESFLDMRPEPPPPPDRAPREEEPPDPFAIADLPVSPQSLPNDHIRQYPQVPPSDSLSSPTAIPFDFRFSRPRPSLRSSRSMSQMPPSSPRFTADLPPRTKPRSRSTEFKSSNEFGPLIVERHGSHKEPAPEEAYPSLPSSYTTSRSSSVHDPEAEQSNMSGDYGIVEASNDPFVPAPGTAIDTSDSTMQSDLLDSQHATPTASSFQHPTTGHDGSPLPGSRSVSPQTTASEPLSATPTVGKVAAMGAVVEGAVTNALRKITQDNDQLISILPQHDLPQHDDDQFQQGLHSKVPDQGSDTPKDDKIMPSATLSAQESIIPPDIQYPQGQTQLQQSFDDVAPLVENIRIDDASVDPKTGSGLQRDANLDSEMKKPSEKGEGIFPQGLDYVSPDLLAVSGPEDNASPEKDFDSRDDSTPRMTTKGKQIKRKSSKPRLPAEQCELDTTESTNPSRDSVPDTLSPEEVRQIQEQDAQDAVDSWFTPSPASKKDKKKKRKGTFENQQESSDSITLIDSPTENPESTEASISRKGEHQIWEMSSDQIAGSIPSVAPDAENVTDDIPRLATMPTQDTTASLLERRQSKSKSKKGKKGRKSAPHLDASPPTSPGAINIYSEQLGGSEASLPLPVAVNKKPEILDERRINSCIELPLEAMPLPPDDDLDLLDEELQESNVSSTGQSDRNIVIPLLELSPDAIPLPLDEDLDLLDQETHESNVSPVGRSEGSRVIPLPEVLPEAIPLPLDDDLDLLDKEVQESNVSPTDQSDRSIVIPLLELSPDAIPVPLDDDLDLLDKEVQESNVSPIGQSNKSRVIPLLESYSEALASVEVLKSPTTEPPREPTVQQDKDVTVDSLNLPSKRKGKKSKKAGLGALEDVAKDKQVPAEIPSNTATQEQNPFPAQEPLGETPETFRMRENGRAEYDTKRKGKKGKRAKQGNIEEPPMPPGLQLDEAAQNTIHQLAEEPDDGISKELIVAEDEWDEFSTKKRGKKTPRSKRGPTNDSRASADIMKDMPVVSSRSQYVEEESSAIPGNILEILDPQENSKTVEDEWTSLGDSREAEKVEKEKRSIIRNDTEMNEGIETLIPSSVVKPIVAGDMQSQDSAVVAGANAPQEDSDVIEGKLIGLGVTKKEKETEEITQDVINNTNKSVIGVDTGLADSALDVIKGAKDKNLMHQEEVHGEELQATEEERHGSSGRKGKKTIGKDIQLGALDTSEIETKLPAAVATPGIIEDTQAGVSPSWDLADISQQESQRSQDERAFSGSKKRAKKDKNRKSKTSVLTSDSLPESAELQKADDIQPDPLAATQNNISTSRDIAAVEEAEDNPSSNNIELEDPLLCKHIADRDLHEPINHSVSDHEEQHTPLQAFVGSKANETETRELDLSAGDQDLSKEQPEILQSKTQGKVLIEPQAPEETIAPTLDSSTTINATRAIQHILGDEVIPDHPSHGRAAVKSPSAMHRSPIADQAFELAEPNLDMLEKKQGKKKKQRKDPSLSEAKLKVSVQAPTPSAEIEVPLHHDTVTETHDRNVPEMKQGRNSRERELELDESQKIDDAEASILAADLEVPLDQGSVSERITESASKKSRDIRNKEKSLSRTPSDHEAATEGALYKSDAPRDLGKEDTVPTIHDEGLLAEQLLQISLQGPNTSKMCATSEPIPALGVPEVLAKGEPETFLELESSKSKKNKKKVKKARLLNLKDEGESALVPEDNSMTDSKGLIDDVQDRPTLLDDKIVAEPTGNLEERPKIEKDRKTAESLRQSTSEGEDPIVSSEPVASHDVYQPTEETQIKDPKEYDPSRADDPFKADDVGSSVHANPDWKSKEQFKESTHEGVSGTPITEQAPAASNDIEVRSEATKIDIGQPFEDADHQSSHLKAVIEDENHANWTRALNLDDNEIHQETQSALTEVDSRGPQDESSIVPTSDHPDHWSRQHIDRSIEESEPTGVVKPADTSFRIQREEFDQEITPLATERPVTKIIEVGKDDFAAAEKSENGQEHIKDGFLTSKPETHLLTTGFIQGPIVAAGSGWSEGVMAEEHTRHANASGEGQSTLEAGKPPTPADPDPGELLSAPRSQEIVRSRVEDGGWDLASKKVTRGEESKTDKFSVNKPQTDQQFAEGTEGPLTTVDPTRGEEPMLEEQTSDDLDIIDDAGNAPPISKPGIGEPLVQPELHHSFETKVDDEPLGIFHDKGKVEKISKRERLSQYDSGRDQTLAEATPVAITIANPSQDNEFIPEEEPYRRRNIPEEISEVDPTAREESGAPLPTLQMKEITGTNTEDKVWGLPSETWEQDKEQRKVPPRNQEDREITDATSSGLPIAGRNFTDPSQEDVPTADMEAPDIVVPEDELLDTQEQRLYDRNYAQELERQGIDTPRSSKLRLPTSALGSEVLDSQRQLQYNHEHAGKPEGGDLEASKSPTIYYPAPLQVPEIHVTQEPLQHQHAHAEEVKQQEVKAPRSPTSTPFKQAAEAEQPKHGSGYSRDFKGEDSEASRIPTIDLPTPTAGIVMLDAQEQQEYDNEYAKELERQLSPLQGERSGLPTNEAVTFQPSMDSMIATPSEERTPLARPPPLEDIVEESRSRSGSVQESEPIPDDKYSHSKATKRSKKGKKSKKYQEPVIWEDDTATPPVENEATQVADVQAGPSAVTEPWEIGASDQPVGLEEPIEYRPLDDGGIVSATHNESREAPDEAEDYFQSGRPTEEDIRGNPEYDAFRRSLSHDIPYASEERPLEQESVLKTENIVHAQQGLLSDERMGPNSTSGIYPPETPTVPANEDAYNSQDHAPAKRNKKGRKAKGREVERDANPLMEDSKQVLDPSLCSEIPAVERCDQISTPPFDPSQHSSHRKEEPLSEGDESGTAGHKTRDTEGIAGTAKLGVAAAALLAEGIARRDPKKGSRKGKKGKKATKWADLEAESPETKGPVSKGEAILENARRGPGPEEQSGIRAWQEGAEQAQISERQSAVTWQESEGTPFQAPTTPATHGLVTEGTDNHQSNSQADHSLYRDSAINISSSPVTSEDVPFLSSVRDSGYPETESSPIPSSETQCQGLGSEETVDDLYGSTSREDTQGYDQSHQKPEHLISRSPSIVPIEVDHDHDPAASQPHERRNRSRSYNSDDSADSGFDIQRRRRRQAMSREAREPSPVSSTTKDRSSALFNSSPSAREAVIDRPQEESASTRNDIIRQEPTWSFGSQGSPEPESEPEPQDSSRESSSHHVTEPISDPTTYDKLTGRHADSSASLFGGPLGQDEDVVSESKSRPSSEVRGRRQPLDTISEGSRDRSSLHAKDKHAFSNLGSPEAGFNQRRVRSPLATDDTLPRAPGAGPAVNEEKASDHFDTNRGRNTEQVSSRHGNLSNLPPNSREGEHRTASAASMRSDNSIHAMIRTPDQLRSASGQSYRSTGTPPLRRVDRSVSGDLRGASRLSEAKLRAKTSEAESDSAVNIPSSSTYDPISEKGKSRADMADVYEGWGDVRGQSPMSPTRPPSMRKRQSIQLLDLETRLDQIVSENRLLQSQKSIAEKSLQEQKRDHSQQRLAYKEALEEHKVFLAQKDSELDELRGVVEDWQNNVIHLTEANERLTASRGADDEHSQRYRELEAEHLHLRERHTELTTGMESLVQREVASHLEVKNSELQRLRDELDSAKQQVRNLQQQLLASRDSEDFVERDEDYFDSQCQSLCQHVQQWVLRFSKFSDMKACYRASEIRDETKLDRMENAILDGTEVDIYLQDRVKRRDVFMAVVMTMIFDYIFTRYLFGMDREQRQKLKNLEKTLLEIGPMSAVCKWRATTLTLLMKREDFARQRVTDTDAIVHEIYDTLATFLPPPSHLVAQIQDSLRKVINTAADLSIEMRTQRADYQMLPPLQPDYDTNGDLAQKVYFNALTMNERSGTTTSNQALQEQGAVVRMVLFPLVVKNEEDDEQIIVCPAQVLTADPKAKKTVRVMSVQGSTQGGRSEASFAGSEGGMF